MDEFGRLSECGGTFDVAGGGLRSRKRDVLANGTVDQVHVLRNVTNLLTQADSETDAIFWPSINTVPAAGTLNLSNNDTSVDLPTPLSPVMAIVWRGAMSR